MGGQCLQAIAEVTVTDVMIVSSSKVKKHKNAFFGIFANIKDVYLAIAERASN
jgi:hypothetical protein